MPSAEEALASFEQVPVPSVQSSIDILQHCRRKKNLSYAKHVHMHMCDRGLEAHTALGNHVVPMFVECGSLLDAQQAFNRLALRNEFSWTSLIQGYIECGQLEHALNLYHIMQEDSVPPSRFTYMALLKACARSKCVEQGRQLHADIADKGLLLDLFLVNTLVDMYAKCGCFKEALEIFAQIPVRDVVSWTALIAGYVEHGLIVEALNFFEQMQAENVLPDAVTFSCISKSIGSTGDIDSGWKLHSEIAKNGLETDPSVGSSLVDMYARCGSLAESHEVFDNQPVQDVALWNALIAGYAEGGFGEHALTCLEQMRSERVSPDAVTYIYCLRACGAIGALEKGRELHADIPEQELKQDPFVGNALVDMYAKCGSLWEAHEVLGKLPIRDVVSWNTLITGYVEHGLSEDALHCFQEMQLDGVPPNAVTLVCGLKACGTIGAVGKGLELHSEISKRELERECLVGNTLVDMYARCGLLAEARAVFDKLLGQDIVSWTALIAGYAQQGLGEEALDCLERMQLEGAIPDAITLVCSLKACVSIGAIGRGQKIHAVIMEEGFEENFFIGNTLLDMYSKHGMFVEASEMLGTLPVRDVVSWNALIAGYAEQGLGEEALSCLLQMQMEGMPPDSVTFICALKACGSIGSLDRGREMHSEIVKKGFERDTYVDNTLVDMYAKCGSLADAQQLFVQMPVQDGVSWTALVAGYVEQGLSEEALDCYQHMVSEGVSPDGVSFVCSLKACGSIAALDKGQELHIEILKHGLEQDHLVGNILVDMYAKCGSLAEAEDVFEKLPDQDVISWTALIAGYAEQGSAEKALKCLEQMRSEGILPDVITLTSGLEACASLRAINAGRELHAEVVKKGFNTDPYAANTLVDMYGKCGSFVEAQQVFDKLLIQDRVSWNALITGYAEHGLGMEALQFFQQMQLQGVSPDEVSWNGVILSFAEQGVKSFELYAQLQEQGLPPNSIILESLLKVCSNTAAFENARKIHAQVYNAGGFEASEVNLANALVDIYSKCGSMVDAQQVFDAMPTRVLTAWNALIAGYARVGENELVFAMFERMKDEGVQPNDVTFLSVLTVCCHAGLLEKGQRYFKAMSKECGIAPSIKHYTCMIDLLGRAGRLDETVKMIEKMPFTPDFVVWSTVLAACQKWGNAELGRKAFEHAVRLDEKHAASFIMMANLYADIEMWEEMKKIESMRVKLMS